MKQLLEANFVHLTINFGRVVWRCVLVSSVPLAESCSDMPKVGHAQLVALNREYSGHCLSAIIAGPLGVVWQSASITALSPR